LAQRKPFLLRVPPELYTALEKWAADELRSVNGQIEYLLATAVKEAGRAERRRAPEKDRDEETPESVEEP
jgi:hypothetical protein